MILTRIVMDPYVGLTYKPRKRAMYPVSWISFEKSYESGLLDWNDN